MQLARRFSLIALTLLIAAGAAQAQASKLLPNDTELVVTVNLKQMLNSEVAKNNKTLIDLGKQLIEQKLDENPAGKYFKQANFNLLTDLHSITLSMPAGRDFGEGLIVIEGKFDAEKIEAAALEASKDKEAGEGTFKVIDIGGAKAFQVTPKDDQKTIYIGVLNKKTMVACTSKTDYANAVARAAGSQQASFKPEFKAALKAVNTNHSISIAATSEALVKLSERAPEGAGDKVQQAGEFLKKIDGFAVSLTIQKDIDFLVSINTKDTQTAKDMENLSKFGLAGVKNKVAEQAKNDERAAAALAVINSIRAVASGANMTISGQISSDTLEKIMQLLPLPN